MDIRRPILVFIITLFFSIFLILGVQLNSKEASEKELRKNNEVYELGKDLTRIFQTVNENYVDKIDSKQLFVQAATDLASRDHYSGYLGEESFADFEENIDGDFVSIGIEYSRKVDHLLVTDILPNSSASGVLKFDDRIYFLNKQTVEGLDSTQIATLLRGPIDSELALGLRRGEKEDLIEIVLKRKEIKKSPLRFSHIIDREKGIGYINIEIFNGHLAKIFKNEYNKLLAGTPKMKSLVLDLRGNPGGGLFSARDFCDLFLKSGLIVATIGNEDGVRGKIEKLNATDKDELKLVPLLILLDRGSASAAELSAGCLQDYQIAKIFGEKSYGKGESQTSFPMFSNVVGEYGIKLTTSKFYTKSGFNKTPKESISGKGVKADYPYDYGFQDKYMARLKSFHRAWGLWSQAIAEGKSIEEAKKKSLYFADLEKSDPGLKEALEILIKQGEK